MALGSDDDDDDDNDDDDDDDDDDEGSRGEDCDGSNDDNDNNGAQIVCGFGVFETMSPFLSERCDFTCVFCNIFSNMKNR